MSVVNNKINTKSDANLFSCISVEDPLDGMSWLGTEAYMNVTQNYAVVCSSNERRTNEKKRPNDKEGLTTK